MSTRKIQTGDTVKITAGKYKGITGLVSSVYSKTRNNGEIIRRAVVSGVPLIAAYQKSYKAAGMAGQMYTKERSVNISNVSLLDASGKISKVMIERTPKGVERKLKTTGAVVAKTKAAKEEEPAKKEKKIKKTK